MLHYKLGKKAQGNILTAVIEENLEHERRSLFVFKPFFFLMEDIDWWEELRTMVTKQAILPEIFAVQIQTPLRWRFQYCNSHKEIHSAK